MYKVLGTFDLLDSCSFFSESLFKLARTLKGQFTQNTQNVPASVVFCV